MKNPHLGYKGYLGSVEVEFEDGILHGKIQFIRDIVTYEGSTPAELKAAFEGAVDEYLADCESLGKSPDKPFSGHFNIRVGEERHHRLAKQAFRDGRTLNDLLCHLIDSGLNGFKEKEVHLHFHSKQEIPFETRQSPKRLPTPRSAERGGALSSEIAFTGGLH